MVCLEIRDTPSFFDILDDLVGLKRRYCREHMAMSLCRLPHVATEHARFAATIRKVYRY